MLSLLKKLFSTKKSDTEVQDPATKLWPFPPAMPAVQEPEKPAEPTPVVAPAEPKPKRTPAAKKPAVVAKTAPRKPRKPRVPHTQ
jgi:hypothetical protein